VTGQAVVTTFEYEVFRDVPLLRFRDRSQPSAVIRSLLLIPLATLEQAWRQFFFTPEPAVTVASFRIVFGVILVVHGLLLWPHASLWYGPQGFLPYKQYFQIYGRARLTVFQFLPDSDLTARVVLAVFITAAAFLSLGILTTVSASLTFLLLVSIHNRNPAILHGGDDVLRVMAFLLICSSAGADLSVDRFASSGQPFVGEYISPWALRLMQLQVSIIYLRAGLAKLGGTAWLEGSAARFCVSPGVGVRPEPAAIWVDYDVLPVVVRLPRLPHDFVPPGPIGRQARSQHATDVVSTAGTRMSPFTTSNGPRAGAFSPGPRLEGRLLELNAPSGSCHSSGAMSWLPGPPGRSCSRDSGTYLSR
jgi:uncharacterized membrane protein YphA (DoxX/SURF4 family)